MSFRELLFWSLICALLNGGIVVWVARHLEGRPGNPQTYHNPWCAAELRTQKQASWKAGLE